MSPSDLHKAPAKVVRCAIYTRVSTEEQSKGDYSSLDAQRTICEREIAGKAGLGWTILSQQYSDPGFSGKDLFRPSVQRLIADVMEGKIDVVVVYRLDRLSRNISDIMRLTEQFQKKGVQIYAEGRKIEPQDGNPDEWVFGIMQGMFAQQERMRIAKRTREKIREMRARGMWTGGYMLLGYARCEKKLVIKDDEAAQIREMFETYLKIQSVERALTIINARYRTKAWTTKGGKHRGGRTFGKTTFIGILRNPVYRGLITTEEGLVKGQHQAIVSEELFEAVQKLLAKNRQSNHSYTRNTRSYLLRGLIRCKTCGSGMTPYHSLGRGKSVYLYYKCTSVMHKGRQSCPVKTIKARVIEQAIVNRIGYLGQDPTVIESVVAKSQELTAIRIPEIKEALRHLAVEKRKVQEEAGQLIKAMKSTGAKTNRFLIDELNRLEARQQELEAQVSLQENELANVKRQAVDPQEVREALQQFSAVFGSLTPIEQDRLLHLVVQGITYDGLQKTISLRLHPLFKGQITQAEGLAVSVDAEPPDWLLGLDSNQQPFD